MWEKPPAHCGQFKLVKQLLISSISWLGKWINGVVDKQTENNMSLELFCEVLFLFSLFSSETITLLSMIMSYMCYVNYIPTAVHVKHSDLY